MRKPGRSTPEAGFALMAVISALSLVLLLLMITSAQTMTTSRLLTLRLTYQGQALNAANAGLVEGLDWFRRQPTVPVTTFNPIRDLVVNPPVDDTDVQTTPRSITRDFLISSPGRVWAHYNVVVGSATAGTGVIDLSRVRRGPSAGLGTVWQLESTGTVYIRNSSFAAFNASPNRVISTRTVRTEIQRVSLNLPANAAITINQGNRANIGGAGGSARVVGTTAGVGIAYATAGSSPAGPQVSNGAVVSGTSQWSGGAGSRAIADVFGVSTLTDLGAIADIDVTAVSELPNPLPAMQIIVVRVGAGNTATFNTARPLTGSGILVIDGNLAINGGPSTFNGVVYVTGNFTQVGPSTVYGGVIMSGGTTTTASVSGSGANFAEVYFDPFMIQQVGLQLGTYRFSRSSYIPCSPGDTNCNSRLSLD